MYSWDDLRYFLALSRAGSVNRAASRLKVASTTVSRRISALERDLDAQLFVRAPGGWVLTAAGERMRAAAERAEQAAVEVGRRVEEAEAEPSGTVRLTTLEVLASHLLAPALPRLFSRYPRIHLDLRCTVRTLDLMRGQADLAVRIGRPEQGDLVARRMVTAVSHPYASRRFLQAHGIDAQQVTSLAGLPQIRLTFEPEWGGDEGPLAPVLSVTSASMVIRACAAGAGVALIADVLARDEPELVPLSGVNLSRELEVWLVMAPEVAQLRRVRAVADFLLEVFLREGPLV